MSSKLRNPRGTIGLTLDEPSIAPKARSRVFPDFKIVRRASVNAGDAKLMIGMSCEDWELRSGGNRKGGFFDPVGVPTFFWSM